jgi:uncharacterized protein with HEPN domain
MTRDVQRLADYLAHIQEAVERIRGYVMGMELAAFKSSQLVQDAVIRNLEVIGEASRCIDKHHPAFSAAHPEIPLASAYQMRNAVAHGYFKVDLDIVWATLQRDLPALHTHVLRAQAEL